MFSFNGILLQDHPGMKDPVNPEIWAVGVANLLYTVTSQYLPDSTTLGELRILTAITEAAVTGSAITSKEISAKTGVPAYAITRVVSRYLENGVLEEKPHPSDGRSKQICFKSETFALNAEWSNAVYKSFEASDLI